MSRNIRGLRLVLMSVVLVSIVGACASGSRSDLQPQPQRPMPTRYPPIVPPTPIASTKTSDSLYLFSAIAASAATHEQFEAYKDFLEIFVRTRDPKNAMPLAQQAFKIQMECYTLNRAKVTARLATYHLLSMQACDEMLHYFQLMDLVVIYNDPTAAVQAGLSLDRFSALDKAAQMALDLVGR